MNAKKNKPQAIEAEILDEMRECSLLKLMNDEQFDKVIKTCKVVELPANTILFEQDSRLTYIYLVIMGDIKLLRLVPNGDEKVMDIVQPGKTFAEGALFSGNALYPVTSTSISPTVVVGILGKTYLSILEDSNELCFNMLGYLSMRLKWMITEVERLTLHNA
ncbi:MAG: Crp/Fnr family transcriptional regulator, partial [Gammaproteobacteria bacterium]|nr:Crp/Fnr family transcriptional regulator [Gammaproteobacteria bacterium]